jgi:hypothetical protein
MKNKSTFLRFAIAPFVLVAAISLFVLDKFNVNVDHLTSYVVKDLQ